MIELIYQGGWFMLPLAVCSVLALGFSIERFVYLWKQWTPVREFWLEVEEPLHKGNWETVVERSQKFNGLLPELMDVVVNVQPRTLDNVSSEIEDFGIVITAELRQFLPAIDFIARVSPLLGLLGTVAGMIRIFSVISEAGAGNPELLAGGISQALVTTATGLIIGVTALFFHHVLTRRVDRILHELEVGARRVFTALKEMKADV
ncbi:MAG: MotA/TolQ/ExbB proton channel family protein [bacterium]